MHIAGGLWVGVFSLFLARNISVPDMVLFWLVLGSVAIIGVFWEFFEFGLNQVWESFGFEGLFQPSLEDTLGDLLADLLGGALAFILSKRGKKNL